MPNDTQQSTVFERHAQSVIVSILLAVALWIGYNVNNNSKVGAELKAEVRSLRELIVLQFNDRYLATEGRALEARVEHLERRADKHEAMQRRFDSEQSRRGPIVNDAAEHLRDHHKNGTHK